MCMNKTSDSKQLMLDKRHVQSHTSAFLAEKADEAQVKGFSFIYGLLILPRQLTDHSFA